VLINVRYPQYSDRFPFSARPWWSRCWRRRFGESTDWSLLPGSAEGQHLPALADRVRVADAGGGSCRRLCRPAFGLGFESAVFDNIAAHRARAEAGGYDWGYLAYASTFALYDLVRLLAGVALSNMYPQTKSVANGCGTAAHRARLVVGFFVLSRMLGWHPTRPTRRKRHFRIVRSALPLSESRE